MICKNCGLSCDDTLQFCPNCGTKLAVEPAPEVAPEAPVQETYSAPAAEAPFTPYQAPATDPQPQYQQNGYNYQQNSYQQAPYQQPYTAPVVEEKKSGAGTAFAVVSLVCGILSLVGCCCCPLLFAILGIAAVVFGILGKVKGGNSAMCIIGIILGAFGILVSIAGAIIGAVMGASGAGFSAFIEDAMGGSSSYGSYDYNDYYNYYY